MPPDALPYTPIAARRTGDPRLDAAHERVRETDNAWRRARVEREAIDDVRRLASAYAKASEDYQRIKFGRVKQRVSVVALLR